MFKLHSLGLILFFFGFLSTASSQTLKRVCYLRQDVHFPIDHVIEHNLCTHLIVAFVEIGAHSNISYDGTFVDFLGACRRSIDRFGSNTKLMFSIGGGGAGGFAPAASTNATRKHLAESILNLIQACSLDGVDIDWEFPSWKKLGPFRPSERDNFVHLLKELRAHLNSLETKVGRKLILTAAVAAQWTIIETSYKPKEMASYVDFINLMAYDFYIYKWYWPLVGHNSALHPRADDYAIKRTLNTAWAANYWHRLGVPKAQIVVGIPTYGKQFRLQSRHSTRPGALASSSAGDCSYSQVCTFLRSNNTRQIFDREAMVPYAFNGHDWISFENELSINYKANWARAHRFGGVMLFSLNVDDYTFECPLGRAFPLHSTVRDIFLS